jgi:hypothetical protein
MKTCFIFLLAQFANTLFRLQEYKHRHQGTYLTHVFIAILHMLLVVVFIYRRYKANRTALNRSSNPGVVALGGLVISVLPIRCKVRGFKPGRGRWILKGNKNLGGEVKLAVPCKILCHVKEPYIMKRDTSRQNSRIFLVKSLLLRYQISLLVIARELWWINKE